MKPQQLRAIRERMKLTQEQFGQRLGFAHGQRRVSELERGARPITRKTALLAEAISAPKK